MLSRLTSILMTVAVVTAGNGLAVAQGDSDPAAPTEEPVGMDTTTAPPPDPTAGDAMPATPAGDGDGVKEEARFGLGLRLRRVHLPRALIELFVEQAATSVSGTGFGVELYRRRGDFELQLGFEYENLDGDPGIWVDKGDNPGPPPNGDEVDYLEFDNFGWFSFEVTFLNHTRFSDMFALRYGGGAGIAILKGDIRRTDYSCAVATLDRQTLQDTCTNNGGPNQQTPYDLPPVFPIINAIIGLQIRPIENVLINIEGGIRTIPFFGGTVGYLF